MHPIRTMRSYTRAITPVIRYQLATTLVLLLLGGALNGVASRLMLSQGRVAVSTGDFKFLFTTWQGLVLLILGIVAAYLYVGMDIAAKIAFAGRWVRGESVKVREVIRDGFLSLRNFMTPLGLLLVLFIAIMAPLAGFGFTISLTSNIKVPTFVSSVIYANPLYFGLYMTTLFLITAVSLANMFSFHGVVLDDMSLKDATRQSLGILRRHWWNYLWRILVFIIIEFIVIGFLGLVASTMALTAFGLVTELDGAKLELLATTEGKRFFLLFIIFLIIVAISIIRMLASPFFMIKMTKLYEEYTKGKPVEVPERPFRFHFFTFLGALSIPVVCAFAAYVGALNFDEFFPKNFDVKVIAHRACGNEGYENTAEGLAAAEKAGAWGAEIDIQRTADGAYVVNHDNTFERVAGDSRASNEMTLAEVKQLKVHANPADPAGPGVPVSTYEEMLDGARDHNLILFVELKGKTADQQMADDAVRIATERGVLDRCVFISLKYDLIKYLEETYPNVETGYLAFASYGDTADIPCDYLALEEQVVRDLVIDTVRQSGKGVLVWTVNSSSEQESFLAMDVDAIITDNMTRAAEEKQKIANWDDGDRIRNVLGSVI